MNKALILKDFKNAGAIGGVGEFTRNAGQFSRHAIVAAFELNGGLNAFAEWVKNNEGDFYTKLFPRLINREMADQTKKADAVEELLEVIDLDAEETVDTAPDDVGGAVHVERRPDPLAEFKERLAQSAEIYARGENSALLEEGV